jgi:hypothetical protein
MREAQPQFAKEGQRRGTAFLLKQPHEGRPQGSGQAGQRIQRPASRRIRQQRRQPGKNIRRGSRAAHLIRLGMNLLRPIICRCAPRAYYVWYIQHTTKTGKLKPCRQPSNHRSSRQRFSELFSALPVSAAPGARAAVAWEATGCGPENLVI